jgi:hypothetical protein
MFQRILVLMLLFTVEFSTIINCVINFKPNIEAQDIEDCNENEELSKEVFDEKFYHAVPSFLFNLNDFLSKSTIYDFVASNFSNPYQTIDSPPPKA